jgi:hypothetical protein
MQTMPVPCNPKLSTSAFDTLVMKILKHLENSDNIFMILRALDPGGGVHHGFARDTSGLFANTWEGVFTEDRNGNEKVQIPNSGILRKKDYYFRVFVPHIPRYTSRYILDEQ